MIHEIFENEVVMLLLGVGVLIFIYVSRARLERLPSWRILAAGFYALLVGCNLTVLEGFFLEGSFWNEFLNYLEHICYVVSSVLVAVWCWEVFGSRKEAM